MKPVEGFNQQYGYSLQKFDYVQRIIIDTVLKHGYEELQLPLIEHSASFSEKIVGKSPWPEWNKKGCFHFNIENYQSSYCDEPYKEEVLLIPEGTISVTRWLGEILDYNKNVLPLKVYYLLSCFRNEILDKLSSTKKREFKQFGLEILGSSNITSDIEILYLICKCMENIGIDRNYIRIRINNIEIFNMLIEDSGIDENDAIILKEYLDYFAECKAGKHSDMLKETENKIYNTLEKYEIENKIMKYWEIFITDRTPDIYSYIDSFSNKYKELLLGLQRIRNLFIMVGINIVIDHCVIRSHEYYTGISYEVDAVTPNENFIEIAGGGRYDRLVSNFISNDSYTDIVPCTGFAFGVERVVLVAESLGVFSSKKTIKSDFYFCADDIEVIVPYEQSAEAYISALKKKESTNSISTIYIGDSNKKYENT